ncbi:MAG: redoxin family protein [Fibrobacter sp.]|nr:redoxin family protein [Fibrobacter sp.]
MNLKKIAFGMSALALVACDLSSSTPAKKVAIDQNTTDEQKFAYMLGAQFGGQNFKLMPRQMGEHLYEDAVYQGLRDNKKAMKDSTFKLQLSDVQLQDVNRHYSDLARTRAQEIQPDSATIAKFDNNFEALRAYMDSLSNARPVVPETPSTGASVTINEQSSLNHKFSYLIGMQFANQIEAIGNQVQTEIDEDYFILGSKDAIAKVRDTTAQLKLPEDSLKAISTRFQEKAMAVREEMVKKQQEEEAKLKAEVAGLKGDTLANGMPKLINYTVKVSGITTKAEDLSAFSGKNLLVFYFSATCGHCAHAAPQILAMAQEFAKDGLTTVAVASGGNNKSGIRKFIDNAKFDESVTVLWDESRQFGELYSDGYVPKVYLVNSDGTYKQYAAFENEKETLKQEIADVLKGKKVEWNPEDPRAKVSDEAKALTDSVKAASAPAAAK